MNNAIEIKELVKNYGDVKAVKGVSFEVKKGEMFGLVGPDGAGKTSIIRTLCGLLEPDSGSAAILGLDIVKHKKEVQNKIGYLSQKFSLYGDLTIDENIEFFADIHNVAGYKERRNEMLEFTRLTPFRKRLAEQLSGGMKQKLALACSLIHKPDLIFLDEPTTGVDPVSRRDFWKILSNLLKEGITIFMSTPYLDEAERCNRIALMNKGKIISLNDPQIVKSSIDNIVMELVCTDIRRAYNLIKENFKFEVQLFGDRIDVIIANYDTDMKAIEDVFSQNKIEITSKRQITPSLENVFIHLVKEEA
jgi:ABC-2 type transport system ATP-binding protein